MVKVAMTSDNHFDINKLNSDDLLKRQAVILAEKEIDYYLIAGDLFNDFQQTFNYVEKLAAQLSPKTKVYYIAGNHDMLKGISYDELEHLSDQHYLNNRYVDVPGTQWRIIGNNGWYDYSFADMSQTTIAQIETWKHAFWVDRMIKQPMDDQQRMAIVLHQVESQFQQAQQAQKKMMLVTHFVPTQNYIIDKPDERMWNMANAMLGSRKMQELIDRYHVQKVLFGHLHIHPEPQLINESWYYDQAVGYHRQHVNEWQKQTFIEQWENRLQIITLN